MDTNSSTQDLDVAPQILILIALLQGLALLILHQTIEFEGWPYNKPQWLFSIYSVVFAAPTMLLLGLSNKLSTVYKWTAAYSIVIFLVSYYIGTQAYPTAHVSYFPMLTFLILTLIIATFKALMYIQHFAMGGTLSYSRLFLLSWRNFLTLGLSLLFMLCTWGILMLWGFLFKAIGINFFIDLFFKPWFYYPALSLANGFGIIIFRQQSNVIDTITRIQQALMKFLLVILVFISIIFLLTLPFIGLAPLWESGGSFLILCMQSLMLFFVNAVYQDDPQQLPYKLWVHRFIYMGLALLPIYSAISFYGLYLRVDQYGWSLDRCWAFLLWAIFAVFSVGYFWAILRLKERWLKQLSWVNVRMGLAVLALMLAVNSPLLDFRKITVNSQIQRFESTEVDAMNLDFEYFRYKLAKPGYEALQDLLKKYKDSHPQVAFRIAAVYASKANEISSKITKQDFLRTVLKFNGQAPEAATDIIYQNATSGALNIPLESTYKLLALDLNEDGEMEYIFVGISAYAIHATLYFQEQGEWISQDLDAKYFSDFRDEKNTDQEKLKAIKALETKDYKATKPKWNDFQIGTYKFKVPANNLHE